jgi:hypothetical protein
MAPSGAAMAASPIRRSPSGSPSALLARRPSFKCPYDDDPCFFTVLVDHQPAVRTPPITESVSSDSFSEFIRQQKNFGNFTDPAPSFSRFLRFLCLFLQEPFSRSGVKALNMSGESDDELIVMIDY